MHAYNNLITLFSFRNGLKAEDFARFVETSAQVKFNIARPINYQLYGLVLASVGGIAAILKMIMSRISGFFTSYRTWAAGSLVSSRNRSSRNRALY